METEQILAGAAGTHAASFVQVRGSIPLYWEQRGYRYRPKIRLSDHTSQMVTYHSLSLSLSSLLSSHVESLELFEGFFTALMMIGDYMCTGQGVHPPL